LTKWGAHPLGRPILFGGAVNPVVALLLWCEIGAILWLAIDTISRITAILNIPFLKALDQPFDPSKVDYTGKSAPSKAKKQE